MPLISVDNAYLAFGLTPLLDHVNFQLDSGERVGLIGRNGCGKSSMLKVLGGHTKLDDGKCWVSPTTRLAYVPQEPVFGDEHTIFEAVAEGLGHLQSVLLQYHALSHAISNQNEDTETLLAKLQLLQNYLEAHDGWQTQSRIENILSRLSLPADTPVSELSGGWKKRVALGRALVMTPDILLLDEPTNHLDFAAIEWLENLLLDFNGAVLFITHDRRFLDKLATRIIELDRGHLSEFKGNFTAYQTAKTDLLANEATFATR